MSVGSLLDCIEGWLLWHRPGEVTPVFTDREWSEFVSVSEQFVRLYQSATFVLETESLGRTGLAIIFQLQRGAESVRSRSSPNEPQGAESGIQ